MPLTVWSMAMRKTIIVAAAAGALLAAPAFAQNAGAPSGNTGVAPASGVPTAEFVNKVAVSDMFEVQSSELALRKNPDRDTKPFARKMVHDHTQTSKQLKALIDKGKVQATLPTSLDSEHQAMLDKLKGLSGKEFDTAYDQMQKQGHTEAVALFQDYAKSGDNRDLKKWAAKTLPHLKMHLSMAEKLK
jgi:putative membrane protein